ncbi:50S ribosomal protein L6 [Candidatus Peregrinibacteria bacterium]|nr:50S ribosomal protein L6 [Candidatus Peregrinibacteria bacterium]
MSRIGKQPIPIPSGVTIDIKNGAITVKGTKGTLHFSPHQRMDVKVEGQTVVVARKSDEILDRSLHGMTRTIISNMIHGVSKGFAKQLEIQGVGYRAAVQGKKLQLSLGFSHQVDFPAPEGISFEIDKEKKNIITVAGIDKVLVGQVAANLRSLRKPEPYKGKGIRYVGEAVRRKAGKAATTAAKGGA